MINFLQINNERFPQSQSFESMKMPSQAKLMHVCYSFNQVSTETLVFRMLRYFSATMGQMSAREPITKGKIE